MSGITDKPVAELGGDRFGIQKYIDGLCKFILQCETPMTISIQGDWGSGKTSMMNMISGEIEDKVYPIMFNTWQFSQFNQSEGLAVSMIGYLIDSLDVKEGVGASIAKKSHGILNAIRIAGVVATGFVAGADAASAVNEATGEKTVEVDPSQAIIELKSTFQEAIGAKLVETGKSRVVIFVDDLDRLQPEKAVELLEVLKLFLDCEDCVFVLAVDYEVVTRGIKKKFGEDVSGAKGKSFFDKIIQLPFKMPVSNYDVLQYVRENLQAMGMACADDDAQIYVKLLNTSIGLNPRAMKRLFNTFQLLDIITSDVATDVEPAIRQRMLFGIICMQMAYEGLYRDIAARCRNGLTSSDLMDLAKDDYLTDPESDLYTYLLELRDDGEDPGNAVLRMHAFMANLVGAIDADSNGEIDDTELRQFTEIMKCSSVTSVGGTAGDGRSNKDWEIRRHIQGLARQTLEAVEAAASGDTALSKLKKARTKFLRSDFHKAAVEGAVDMKDAGECGLVAYINYAGDNATRVEVWLETWDKAGKAAFYKERFGDDPLQLGVHPEISRYGSYGYDLGIVTDGNVSCFVSEKLGASMDALDAQGLLV